MPTTSSPWASPSSPAGRRLLQSEPATADDIPVLDAATLALGAALVEASDRAAATASPAAASSTAAGLAPARGADTGVTGAASVPAVAAAVPGAAVAVPPAASSSSIASGLAAAPSVVAAPTCGHRRRRRTPHHHRLLSAALVVGLLAVGTTVGLDRPATATTPTAAASLAPATLGRAAGLLAVDAAPVTGGQVAVDLIAPVETLRAEPKVAPRSSLAHRLGTSLVQTAEDTAPAT